MAAWPSQTEGTVCFCGYARCFFRFHTVDKKPSHLRGTGCPAHVSVARHTGYSDFTISRRPLTSLTMFIGFSPQGVSHAAFPLWFGIIYELWSGKGLSLPPALHQSMWRLVAGSSTAVLEYIYSKGKPVRMWRQALEDTHLRREESGQGCQWGKESLGRTWECWTKIEIHQGTNEWELDRKIGENKEIDGWILRRRNGIAVEL